ncbi:homoserine dehydrogenase [Spirochaetota bacterium]
MKSVKVGLVGFGTIGNGVFDLLRKNGDLIKNRTGLDISIKTICDIRLDYLKKNISDIKVTSKWEEVVNDKEIDTVIELIGGTEPAKTIVLKALEKGKNVITANKKLVAEEANDIFSTLKESSGSFGFEASVGGGIPCILALKSGLAGNNIRSVMGILNGTTNYILTKMDEFGLPFDGVLKDAQDKGFAEADPTFDIEGIDAGHKISLLAMLSYGLNIDFKSIPIEGITRISDLDISFARDMGYVIKLLGVARLVNNKLDIGVHPSMISKNHPLASVRDEYNAVMYDGDMTDPVILYGKGAGSYPTASAVVSDIIQIYQSGGTSGLPMAMKDAQYLDQGGRFSRYYLRIKTEDSPGILSKVSGVLGKFEISIASVIQKESDSDFVPLIITTHVACEEKIKQAVVEIGNFDFIHDEVMLIKIEDSFLSGDKNE